MILGLMIWLCACGKSNPAFTTISLPVENTPSAIGICVHGRAFSGIADNFNSQPFAKSRYTYGDNPISTEATSVNLVFVGDIMLGRSLAQRIIDGKGDFDF